MDGSTAARPADQPMDANSIPGRAAALFPTLDAVDNYVARLTDRLSGMVTGSDPSPGGALLDEVRPARSSHGDLLAQVDDRIGAIGQRLSSLLDHLDI